MQDRFNDNGKTLANPSGWSVTVNACASVEPAPNRSFLWAYGDRRSSEGCVARLWFSRLGWHNVALTVRQGAKSTTATQSLLLRDHLIVSIGDSIAAGEGAPQTAKKYMWSDGRCHRSRYGAHAQFAHQVEQRDPHSSVTFIHLACSGATINQGILGGYEGIDYTKDSLQRRKPLLRPQLDAAIDAVGGRTVDALLVQVGANDATFSKLATRCAATSFNCTKEGTAIRAEKFVKQQLASRYNHLASQLTQRLAPRRVYIGEYPDPLHNERGTICTDILGGINRNEALWLYRHIVRPLNEQIRAASNRHHEEGWVAVEPIETDFRLHGYCARGRWIRTLSESKLTQGDRFGSLHPNRTGYQGIATRYLQTMLSHDTNSQGTMGALSNPGMEAGGGAPWGPGNGTESLNWTTYWRGAVSGYMPHSGNKLLATNTGIPGRSIAQEVRTLEPAGSTVTFSAWLRATHPRGFSGTLAVWALGGENEVAIAPFTVGTEWTRIEARLNIRHPGHTAVKPEIYLDTVGQDLLVDSTNLE